MEFPSLIEPNVRQYIYDKLNFSHQYKTYIQDFVFNISVFLIFVSFFGLVLYFSRKRKLTPQEMDEKMRREQEYIVSKIRDYKMMNGQIKSYSNITNLPLTNQQIL
jgi:hypothetical protein